MGLFNKKRDEKKVEEISELPELPKLPELPENKDEDYPREIRQLPRFPTNSLGKKFSQDTIKEAITGEKEDEEFADEFWEESQMMQEPLKENFPKPSFPKKPLVREISSSPEEYLPKKRDAEPIFVRMDKFQEGMDALEKARKQILDVEKLIRNIREVKESEEKELESWERQIQIAKSQIDRVDKNIFSKLE